MSKKLWGGRFNKKTDPLVEEFTRSVQYDYKIAEYDLIGSMIHVQVLKKVGYLTAEEAARLSKGIHEVYESVVGGSFKPDQKSEDIHTNIQNVLQKKAGNLALKLHTARSRNDQVVFSTKVYSKVEIAKMRVHVSGLIKSLEKLISRNSGLIIPGFTHMQHAQPVYLKDYLGAYVEMLKRDIERLDYVSKNMKVTIGSGALAGTPIDADEYNIKASDYIKGLNIGIVYNIQATTNSLDSVSDRDFVVDIISALSIIAMHLSRLSEDLIIWSTKEFSFIELDDSFCTGSSLMPQKKNPDVLELVRGYAGRLYGNLVSVLTMMKGLPLTYNRDMQLDKEPLFNSFEIVSAELRVISGLIASLKFNEARIKEHLKDESLYATDMVYYLVDKGIPFRLAHSIVGKLVKYSLDKGAQIKDLPEDVIKKFSPKFVKKEMLKILDPEVSVKSKRSIRR